MEQYHSIGTTADWVVMVFYFLGIMLFGTYFSKYNRNTTDFFFGGRRFSWWLIAMSIVATGVGSHSFIKYSAKGFEHGISSTMTYMNDWFFLPFFLFGWLPIVIYTRIRSIPEYFEKRFSPLARFIATIFQLFYMVGYVGIGLLTMGKAILPLLPQTMTILGVTFGINLMGLIIVIGFITGVYITLGGQTAVIFTDLMQGFILVFAGMLVFVLGIRYVGGFDQFWNLLPATWKLPLAHFNNPPDFNFVGIFWQDGVAGSIGFLFMNMGLLMRFMATKSVDEARKAASFNVLFMLPISAIVVGNAGWIGKAISVANPSMVSPNINPDSVFVVIANIISHPGIFGFIMASLTAALMSTVDTLINASAAVYINDVHRPLRKWLKKKSRSAKEEDKKELGAARIASIVLTMLGVVAVIPFSKFPTVYEAHGYFHSTLTPPLVTAIFLGVFWKKFTPAAVIATFLGGAALMIIGARYPAVLISPFDHGTFMDAKHPYTYISALYNSVVCVSLGVIVALSDRLLKRTVQLIKRNSLHYFFMSSSVVVAVLLFAAILLNLFSLELLVISSILLTLLIALTATYFIKYDPEVQTTGLTAWSMHKAKEMFKGGKINEQEGKIVKVHFKLRDDTNDYVNLSIEDMQKMAAEVGDLVYVSDARKYLGGLKSFHSKIGEPHTENGIICISQEHQKAGLLKKSKILTAEKEI